MGVEGVGDVTVCVCVCVCVCECVWVCVCVLTHLQGFAFSPSDVTLTQLAINSANKPSSAASILLSYHSLLRSFFLSVSALILLLLLILMSVVCRCYHLFSYVSPHFWYFVQFSCIFSVIYCYWIKCYSIIND